MKNRILIAAHVVALSLLASAAVSALAGDAETQMTPADSVRPPVQAIDPALSAGFAVLRRPQRPDEALALTGPFGANGALARRVDTGSGPVWLVPADGALCLRAEDAVGAAWACAPAARAASEGLILSLRSEDPTDVGTSYGVLPDAAGGAALIHAGAQSALAASDNAYAAQTEQGDRVQFDPGSGEVTTSVP
jgi:hypothetical protein